MTTIEKTEKDCENRQEYLVRLAIAYIRSHTGFVGMDDEIFYDDAECDGYALADDLEDEFNIEGGDW